MIIAANWKMQMDLQSGELFLEEFKKLVQNERERESFLFFPAALLAFLFRKEKFYWGCQNAFHELKGAWTGENSLSVVQELSGDFCLLGHSERRIYFQENEKEMEKKFQLMQKLNMIPVICVGESEKEKKDKEKVLEKQLCWLKKYQEREMEKQIKGYENVPFIVAYEPVWSIGTGDTPRPSEVNETHSWIKNYFSESCIPILYGGSVKEDNVSSFAKEKFVDGFLVGGASLKAKELYSIYNKAKADV